MGFGNRSLIAGQIGNPFSWMTLKDNLVDQLGAKNELESRTSKRVATILTTTNMFYSKLKRISGFRIKDFLTESHLADGGTAFVPKHYCRWQHSEGSRFLEYDGHILNGP